VGSLWLFFQIWSGLSTIGQGLSTDELLVYSVISPLGNPREEYTSICHLSKSSPTLAKASQQTNVVFG